jgi:hypothetical protein
VKAALAACALALAATGAAAQPLPEPEKLMAMQREKMAPLKAMDGVWRGPAWVLQPDGTRKSLTQTERIGPFLDGSVKVLEGRGYEADGRLGFNAFGIVYYDLQRRAYGLRSFAQGRGGDFKFEPTADGYAWEVSFPGGRVNYVATIKDGKLREVGHTTIEGRPTVQTFEMNLERVGDTDWPLGNPILPK